MSKLDFTLMAGIYNPKAGGSDGQRIVDETIDRLSDKKILVTLLKTSGPGDATRFVSEYVQRGYDKFICFGGDGTLFEMINGMFPKSLYRPVRIGVVPIGTGNSFLKDYIPKPLWDYSEVISRNQVRPADVIELTHEDGVMYWCNIFSFGFTAEVGALRNRNKFISKLGPIGYSIAALSKLRKLHATPYTLTIDQRTIQSDAIFLSFNNTRYTGGNMLMAPEASPSDALVDLVEVQNMTKWELIKAYPKIFSGKHTTMAKVKTYKGKHIDFSFDKAIEVMVDGEVRTIQPKSMRVISNGFYVYA